MQIQLNNSELKVRANPDGLISLTDLWKATGSVREKAPNFWVNQEATQQLIETAAGILNATQDCILKSAKGRSGGTWAHKNIALAYAKYLSPELHLAVNQAYLERLEEEANPVLAIERGNARAERTWSQQGKSKEWIGQRIFSVATRKYFAGVLAQHGVAGNGFRNCTNAIYVPMYGGTTTVVRAKLGIGPNVPIRDNMSMIELSTIQLAENVAAEAIDRQQASGNAQCELVCGRVARVIARSVVDARKAANR